MLKRLVSVLAIVVIASGFVAGCSQRQKAAPKPTKHSMSEPVAIKQAKAGSDQALRTSGVRVINNEAELKELGAESFEIFNPNFENESIVILSLGEQKTGGYWVEITGLQQVGETLYVQGVANKPGEEEIVTEAIEYPYAAVLVEKVEPKRVIPDLNQVTGQGK